MPIAIKGLGIGLRESAVQFTNCFHIRWHVSPDGGLNFGQYLLHFSLITFRDSKRWRDNPVFESLHRSLLYPFGGINWEGQLHPNFIGKVAVLPCGSCLH